jgi:predicted GNAT superfamily acetyltransferase
MYVEIRELHDPEEVKKLEEIQRLAWGGEEIVVPHHIMIAAREVGGILLGAYHNSRIIGYVFGFPGEFKGFRCMYSHQLAVIPEYQNYGIGSLLKLKQREHALSKGYRLIVWTYDPLRSKNAMLNVNKLGTITDTYLINHYGPLTDALNRGIDTDRFMVEWWIDSGWYYRRIRYKYIEDTGLQYCIQIKAEKRNREVKPLINKKCISEYIGIEIPTDIDNVGEDVLSLKRRWREVTREAFISLFENGYKVFGYYLYRKYPFKGIYMLKKNFKID